MLAAGSPAPTGAATRPGCARPLPYRSEPGASFVHVYPGLVRTSIYTNSFPAPLAAVYNYGMWPMMWPFSVNIEESGQRHLFHSTSARYPASKLSTSSGSQGTAIPDNLGVAVGSAGKPGSGAYLMNWKGETSAGAS